MRFRLFVPFWILLLLALAFVLGLVHAGHHNRTVTISLQDDEVLDDCGDIEVRFGERWQRFETVRGESVLTATRTELPTLRAALPEGGGISVRSWDQDRFEVTICKAAGGTSTESAQALLDKVSASIRDGRIVVDGPKDRDWVAHVLVRAPEKAPVDLEATNGGVSLRDLAGQLRVRTENGPVDLHHCTGDIRVDAENGPIGLSGGGGHVVLRAQNGPISVELGDRWEGEGLEVRTENGPLGVKLPSKLASGVRIESSGYSPFVCKASACSGARRTWDDERKSVELGGSPTLVRMTTVNGPISIESREYD